MPSSPLAAGVAAPALAAAPRRGSHRSLTLRYDRGWNGNKTRRRLVCSQTRPRRDPHCSISSNLEILKISRVKFEQEISFRAKDKDVSLAKALFYIAAEDEAFMSLNRDMDARALMTEREDASLPAEPQFLSDNVDEILLAGRSIIGWLNELDRIVKEVEAELVSRDIGCHLVQVLEAVNVILFESKGFKRFPLLMDSKFSYLHTVLSSGCGSAIMLSIIYIEICQRLGVTIVGSRVGQGLLIWPQTANLEGSFRSSKRKGHNKLNIVINVLSPNIPLLVKELFRTSSGHSLFAVVNGRCVEDPRSKASDVDSKLLLGLDIATNRDIIGIALANLIRLHWKHASRVNHGLMLTSPLRPVYSGTEKTSIGENAKVPLLRPQELRLAIMASERLLLLQPHNWSLRRDHGMLLYHSRRYGEAVQELSICMAFAPEEEAEVLEPFVEKLHLLRLESSWKSLEGAGSIPVP